MRRILILCILVWSSTGDREYNPSSSGVDSLSKLLNDSSLSELFNDPDLWLILKKRLGNSDARDECSADKRRNNTIIRTQESVNAGAKFIDAPSVDSYESCAEKCCATRPCNTAVIKAGQGSALACYLFDCKHPSVCSFTSHPGFVVLEFPSSQPSDQHADELAQLALSSAGSSPSATVATTPVTDTVTKRVASQHDGENRHSAKLVALFGECRRSSDCRDRNTDCLSGYCVCQQGYHVIDLQCRRDCNQDLEFECANKGSPLLAECIAVYDYCDGTIQCSDGSDETSCLESSRQKGESEARGNKDKSLLSSVSPTPDTPSSSVHDSPTKLTNKFLPSSSTATTKMAENLPLAGKGISEPARVSPGRESPPPGDTAGQDVSTDVTVEKVEKYFWKMETNRGAVVALIVGIILTTTLLVFAGCRLRHFRKRYRKGRHLNSNDADYLINGMYL